MTVYNPTPHHTTPHHTTPHHTTPLLFCRKAFRKIFHKFDSALVKLRVNLLWPIYSHVRGWKGTTNYSYGRELIISLTSFPPRIKTVHITIRSLLLQSMKPNRIILWLASDEFPNKDKDLPQRLLDLQRFGLEIRYCENFRSFKKLVPALKAYPEADIVTADDDLYYRPGWLGTLYAEHMKHQEDVCAHRITKFYIDEAGEFRTIGGGYDTYSCPSYLHKVTGVGGVLYPAHSLHNDVTDAQTFTRICTTNDDIWFWLMAVRNGTRVRRVSCNISHLRLVYVGNTQKGPTLSSINDRGDNLFWKDFNRMIDHYPELDAMLREEYSRMKKGA